MERVYIGLGSNLAEPRQQLHSALQAIAALPHSRLLGVSSFYLSDPLGPADQREDLQTTGFEPRPLLPRGEVDVRVGPLPGPEARVHTMGFGRLRHCSLTVSSASGVLARPVSTRRGTEGLGALCLTTAADLRNAERGGSDGRAGPFNGVGEGGLCGRRDRIPRQRPRSDRR